jgi:uncharacterized damage-inducible protein DinB
MLTESTTLMQAVMAQWRESIKPGIIKALDLTPEDKLDWKPGDTFLTFREVFLHIARTSGWWYTEFMKEMKREPLGDDFVPSKQELAGQLDEHWDRLEKLFAEPDEVLERIYQIEHEGTAYRLSGYWVLVHLLEHDIHHRCQINHYLRMLDITPPEV